MKNILLGIFHHFTRDGIFHNLGINALAKQRILDKMTNMRHF